MMGDRDADDLRRKVLGYSSAPGFCRTGADEATAITMEHHGDHASMILEVRTEARQIDVAVELRPARGGRGRDIGLRLFFDRAESLLGGLCVLTGTAGSLSQDTLGDWMDTVLALCPETYALLSKPGMPPALARVEAMPRTLH